MMKQYRKQRRAIDNNKWLEYIKLYIFLQLTTYCIDYIIHNVPYE